MNKYYVGARHLGEAVGRGQNGSATHESFDAAIAEAKEKVRKGEQDTAIVVKIVAVIRKEYPPLTVEYVE